MSKLNLNPMADWGYVNNSRFRFLSIRNQGGGVEPVPPEPVIPTDRILYTVVEGGIQPTSTWITTNCSDNVFDAETGEGYLVLNEGVTTIDCPGDDEEEIYPNMFNDSGEDSNIATVVIPTQITSIGTDAFAYCSVLTSVTIPNSVTSIGEYSFSSTALKTITIPNSVTIIGESAFEGCSSLISVTIPNSVTSISDNAFYDCKDLTSVIIPDSVISIGDYAFYDCKGLTSVIISNSITIIGESAFENCISLNLVTCFATTPPELGADAFLEIETTTCSVPEASISAYEGSSWYNNPFTTFTAIQE